MSFWRFLLKRLILMAVVLLGVTVITFTLSHVIPADPVAAAMGDRATEAEIARARQLLGLDKPLPVQFAIYMSGLLQGDLGESIRNRRPVALDLRTYLPATIELATGAILIAVLVGIPTGVVSAVYKDRWQDQVTRVFSLTGVSLPVFYLALVLLAIFYSKLGWLPGPGRLGPYTTPPLRVTGLMLVDATLAGNLIALKDALWHLVLPSFVLGFHSVAIITRMTRSSMLEVLGQDYVRTARAKGLTERLVIFRHALRNAMIPTVTVIGLAFGSLLAGAVLTETIFSWPGIGRYATDSVVNLDIPAILGVTLVAAVVYSSANLLVDVVYALLDPRIRYD